jgi:hypothetical protein
MANKTETQINFNVLLNDALSITSDGKMNDELEKI